MSPPLVITISSMALFDLHESHEVFINEGIQAYTRYQMAREHQVLAPGIAFPLVQKLLQLNQSQQQVEITLVSRNSADTGLRIFHSIDHYNLPITKAGFTGGNSPEPYLRAFGSHLFLSENEDDIRQALSQQHAAAKLLCQPQHDNNPSQQVRIAFDGDAVLFSDESEIIYQQQGLDAFLSNEKKLADVQLQSGPFKNFLAAIHHIQQAHEADACPIRTALVTARCAPAHERVVKTLRAWDIRIDEAFFLGGLTKAEVLKAFHADIFFDDQKQHCEKAEHVVAAAHVPNGIMNAPKDTVSSS